MEDSDLGILDAKVQLVTGPAADPLLVTLGEKTESFVFNFAKSASIGPQGPEPLTVVMLDCDTAIVIFDMRCASAVRSLQKSSCGASQGRMG